MTLWQMVKLLIEKMKTYAWNKQWETPFVSFYIYFYSISYNINGNVDIKII